MTKLLVALFLLTSFFGAAEASELQSGRSVAVNKQPQRFWLSEDLNRLAFQHPAAASSQTEATRKDQQER